MLAFWTGSTGMVPVINGFNIAYQVREKRPWWRRRMVALGLTVFMGLLASLAMLLILTGDTAASILVGAEVNSAIRRALESAEPNSQ